MATAVIMPRQGQSVESCILTELKKRKGDTVQIGDVLFSYETDKAAFEEEARVAGEVLAVFFDEGDEVPVLSNVMVVGQPGESIDNFVYGDVSWTCKVKLTYVKIIKNNREVVVGSDGICIYSNKNAYFYCSKGYGFDVRFGSGGIRCLVGRGLEKYKNNEWIAL